LIIGWNRYTVEEVQDIHRRKDILHYSGQDSLDMLRRLREEKERREAKLRSALGEQRDVLKRSRSSKIKRGSTKSWG
jgi:hypothetical protein